MSAFSLTTILYKAVAMLIMLLAFAAQPIVQSVDLLFDTNTELVDLDSQQEPEEEQHEKDNEDEKIELYTLSSPLDNLFIFTASKDYYSQELRDGIDMEISIPPPDVL